MRHPKNCAVVTLSSGAEAVYHNCNADQFDRSGDLTITDRTTFSERIYPAGSWKAYVVYDAKGNYLNACDLDVRVTLITGYQQPPAA
jgi:hypothetical protein